MFMCLSDETLQFRSTQLKGLKEILKHIGIPDDLASIIIHGIEHWERSVYDPSFNQRGPTYGSVLPTDILLTQAYSEQTRCVGCDNFLRGRISVLWGKAYVHHNQIKQKHITSLTTWTSSLIHLILEYFFSLWEFRNGVMHGHTNEEIMVRESNAIASRIHLAYLNYQDDHFHVPNRWQSLFTSKTLDQQLKQDHDTLLCWLRSYDEAVALQRDSTQRFSDAAKTFFQPRKGKSYSKKPSDSSCSPQRSMTNIGQMPDTSRDTEKQTIQSLNVTSPR
jgi:hypothetical protein